MAEPVTDFVYLKIVAAKYGLFYFAKEFEEFVTRAGKGELAELAEAYHAVLARDDSERLSRWIDRHHSRKQGATRKQIELAARYLRVLVLFAYLGDVGIPPFNSKLVKYVEITRKPDWSRFPPELSYCLDYIREFGVPNSELQAVEYLKNATPEALAALERTASRMRINGDQRGLDRWLDLYMTAEHPEGWIAYCLLMVMDAAGFNFNPIA